MKKYKHLDLARRYHISALIGVKSIRAIARAVGVSPSTVLREIRRNSVDGKHDAVQAHAAYLARKSAADTVKPKRVSETALEFARYMIREQQWSPEQIARSTEKFGLEPISHETVYRMVIEDRKNGGGLYKHLRRKAKRYRKRLGKVDTHGIRNRRPIDDRPKSVDDRMEFGHWEADTVIGQQKKGKVLVTIVERKTRFIISGLAKSKSAQDVSDVMIALLKPFGSAVKTITCDNGREFAYHEKVDQALGSTTYFANPYHSWERGTNENTNGLARQFLPKGVSMDHITDNEIQEMNDKLNSRPRRVLQWMTPIECVIKELQSTKSALVHALA